MPGYAIPVLGQHLVVNVFRLLRHRGHPQYKGGLAVAFGWYNIGYGTFAMVESIANRLGLDKAQRSRFLPSGTALTATSLDLLVDPYGLKLGL